MLWLTRSRETGVLLPMSMLDRNCRTTPYHPPMSMTMSSVVNLGLLLRSERPQPADSAGYTQWGRENATPGAIRPGWRLQEPPACSTARGGAESQRHCFDGLREMASAAARGAPGSSMA